MPGNFKLYSKYYNLLYGDKNYSAEAGYVRDRIKTFAPSARSVLEFGSGTGGHGLLLQEMGYSVFGIERSADMVAIAKQKGLPCEVADITSFKLDKTYDAVISLFHVISYLTSNDTLIAAFENANKHLHTGGIFLFDVWYSPAVYVQKPVPRIKRMSDNQLEVTRIAEPSVNYSDNIIDVKFTVIAKDKETNEVSELVENHPMRHFTIPEIDLLARQTGFEISKAEEFLTSKSPSEDTWGVCFILKKVKSV